MPALQSTRQASQAPWFDSEPAVALRVLERQLLLPQLSVLPTQPWLWIAPSAAWLEGAQLGGRGPRVFRAGPGPAGGARAAAFPAGPGLCRRPPLCAAAAAGQRERQRGRAAACDRGRCGATAGRVRARADAGRPPVAEQPQPVQPLPHALAPARTGGAPATADPPAARP